MSEKAAGGRVPPLRLQQRGATSPPCAAEAAESKAGATPRPLLSVPTPLRSPRGAANGGVGEQPSSARRGQEQEEAAEHLQGGLQQMRSQLEDCVSHLSRLSGAATEVTSLRKDREALRAQLRSGEGLLQERSQQLAEAHGEAEGLRASLLEAQGEAQERRVQAERLQREAEGLRASLSEAEELRCREAEGLRASLSEAERLASEGQRSLEAERSLSAARAASADELRGELAAAALQREEADSLLTAAQAACAAAEQRATDAEERLAQEQLERERLSQAFCGAQSAQAAVQQELAEAELAAAHREGELSQRQGKLEALRAEMDKLEEQLGASEARSERLRMYEEKLAVEQDKNLQLTSQLSQWEDLLDEARAEASQMRVAREREAEEQSASASKARAALEELECSRQMVAQSLQEISELESLVRELRGQLEEQQERLDECARDRRGARRQLDERSEQLRSREEEVSRLREGLEAARREQAQQQLNSGLAEQNKELTLTLRQLKQDVEMADAENRSLREAVALFEEDLERVTDRRAQAVGHMNHKQKIRYTLKLKEEINRLFAELKKARQRIVQLECSKEGEGLLDALAAVGALVPGGGARASMSTSPPRMHVASTPQVPRGAAATPRVLATAFTPSRGSPARVRSPSPLGPGEQATRLFEAERRCHMQEQALERISVDFQHLRVLIERLVMPADSSEQHAAGGDAGGHGGGGGGFPALLQRLRGLVSAEQARRAPRGLAAGPEAWQEARELAELFGDK